MADETRERLIAAAQVISDEYGPSRDYCEPYRSMWQELADALAALTPEQTMSDGHVRQCDARHSETGALCELPLDHDQNHRGPFAHGIAQWPYDNPVPVPQPSETGQRDALLEARAFLRKEYPDASLADGYWPGLKPLMDRMDAALAATPTPGVDLIGPPIEEGDPSPPPAETGQREQIRGLMMEMIEALGDKNPGRTAVWLNAEQCSIIRAALASPAAPERTAGPTPEGRETWQDISTAPTAGEVDLWVTYTYCGPRRVMNAWRDSQGVWLEWCVDGRYPAPVGGIPTHWMPLPAPPVAGEGQPRP